MKIRFVCLGFSLLCATAYANDNDRLLQLRQEIESNQQRQEKALVENESEPYQGENQGADLTLQLMRAINTQNQAETAKLLAIYQQQADANPDLILFVQGNQAVFTNDLERAIVLYKKLYRQNPQFLRGKLDLARLLFIDKQNKEAKALFSEINVPEIPVLNQKVKIFTDALDEREALGGSISIGHGYNTNLNQSSGNTIYRAYESCNFDSNGDPILDEQGQLSCRTEQLPAKAPDAVRSQMQDYEIGFKKRISLIGHHGAQFNAYALGHLYPNHSQYNEHMIYINPVYSFQSKNHQLTLGPSMQYNWVDGHLQNSSHGFNIGYSRDFSDKTSVSFQLERKNDHYRDERLNHFNGPQTLFSSTGIYALPQKWIVFSGYDYLQKKSQEKVDSYHRHGWRIGINKRFGSGIDATLQYLWRKTTYQDYHAWLDTKRKDIEQTYQANIKFDYPVFHGFTPIISIKHTDNKSSSWINRYKRNEYMLKIEYAF